MRLSLILPACLAALALTGCGMGTTASSTATNGLAIKGTVYGGQAPIAGAHVYLLSANPNGYNFGSVSLLNAAATGNADPIGAYVTTNAQGGFSISGDYTCQPNIQAYIYTSGGNAGSGANSAATEMAVLGGCPGTDSFFTTTPFVQVNEVTTVAAAYALAGFATDAIHISSGTSTLAHTGLYNAFANAANLVNIASGTALSKTPNGNGTVPAATINTIADIIAACVNSTGPGSVQCTTLFQTARANGAAGNVPVDTASAAINIAHYPGVGVSTLLGLVAANSPFQPTVTNPNDFSIGISYTGAGMNKPYTVAIDSAGAVWTANSAGGGGVSKLSPLGVPLSGATTAYTGGGVGTPNAVAIDSNNNAWAVNGVAALAKFTNLGTPLSPAAGFNPSGAGTQLGLAIDGAQNIWTTNYNTPSGADETTNGGSIPAGAILQPFTGNNTITFPIGVAIADDNTVWIANSAGSSANSLVHLSTTGALYGGPYMGGGMSGPHAVAIDGLGYIWTANMSNNTLSKFSPSGTPASTSAGFTGGGLSTPTSIAVDGANNIWVCNNANNTVSAFTEGGTAVSNAGGYTSGGMSAPQGVAVDPSGNVWVANSNGNTLTQIIGIAIPAVQPLATAVNNNMLGAKP